jgi:DNA-binding beta-propeller fold protein YncE
VSVAVTTDGKRAFVAHAAAGTVTPVDLVKKKALRPITLGGEPSALLLTPNNTRLIVANAVRNAIDVLDVTVDPPVLIATRDVSVAGTSPRALAITNNEDNSDTDEALFVTLFYAQLRAGKTSVQEGQDDQREGRVLRFETQFFTVTGPATGIPLGPIANAGFNSNGQLAPANGLTPAVASTNPQTFTTPTGAYPNQLAAIALHPTSGLAYVVSTGASPNGPLRFNQMAQGLVSVFNPLTNTEFTAGQTDPSVRRTSPLNLNQGVNLGTTPAPRLFLTNPVAIAWRPNGSDAWVAIQNSNLLIRLTADVNGVPTVGNPLVAGPSTLVRVDLENPGGDFLAGKAPRGLAINSDGTRAFVFNFISRNVSIVDISNPTAPTVAGTVATTKLPPKSGRDATAQLGAELFYTGRGPEGRMSSESWGGCIVCHPNGRSDNVTWMFDAGPRQTVPLDGTFAKTAHGFDQRILNWSAVRDEVQDFELNTRNVFGGRGLIDDDRIFLTFGGAFGPTATPTDAGEVQAFNQFTGAVSDDNPFLPGKKLPFPPNDRRDFGIVQVDDGRVFLIGGRFGDADNGAGTLLEGAGTVLEFNPRKNKFSARSNKGFTPRHSLGAAAVRTKDGVRIYAIGGYTSTDPTTAPSNVVEEYDPATNKWRTVASLPTAVAQFGVTTAGGVNTAEPLELVHVVSGNGGSENAPSVVGGGSIVQRFQADPAGPGTWSAFSVAGLTPRRNHGAATALRGTSSRVFVIGGQNAAGTVLDTVEEYLAQAVTAVATPHTSLPAPRAQIGIASSLTTNQIYVFGGIDNTGVDQTAIFEYTVSLNGPVAGPAGTPSGTWVTRGNLAFVVRQLGAASIGGVTNFLPRASSGRDPRQDAIAVWIQDKVRPFRGLGDPASPSVQEGRSLFGTTGLVIAGFSCATCHGGPLWTRSLVDYPAPPSAEVGIGFGDERVIGAELRATRTQPNTPGPVALPQFPGVLINVGTFTPNTAGGRVNEIRANAADASQAVAPLGANGFNIPSLFSVAETAPYFYNGLAQTLDQVLDGSQDGNGGVRHHFVTNALLRARLVEFLRSIDKTTPIFP